MLLFGDSSRLTSSPSSLSQTKVLIRLPILLAVCGCIHRFSTLARNPYKSCVFDLSRNGKTGEKTAPRHLLAAKCRVDVLPVSRFKARNRARMTTAVARYRQSARRATLFVSASRQPSRRERCIRHRLGETTPMSERSARSTCVLRCGNPNESASHACYFSCHSRRCCGYSIGIRNSCRLSA